MRVIAGIYKGRKLLAPKDSESIRPTSDKVKEAMFSILAPYIPGARVCDVFAGSGALGIEALSRGAVSCTFIDRGGSAGQLLRANLAALDIGSNARICKEDFRSALKGLARGSMDIVIADPPYSAGYYDELMKTIIAAGILAEEGIVMIESADDEAPDDIYDGLSLRARKKYGKTLLSVFERM